MKAKTGWKMNKPPGNAMAGRFGAPALEQRAHFRRKLYNLLKISCFWREKRIQWACRGILSRSINKGEYRMILFILQPIRSIRGNWAIIDRAMVAETRR
jgi:hypothetical protein